MAAITFGLVRAAELRGRVVSVADGDTITVLDAATQQHRVRLAGLDAPEAAQPFGDQSRRQLSRWVAGQSVVVDWYKRDQYGRIIGVVLAAGHDVGLEQGRSGMAWWFRRFAAEQSEQDRLIYEAAESEARAARRGLWSERNPTPPWEWRQQKRP